MASSWGAWRPGLLPPSQGRPFDGGPRRPKLSLADITVYNAFFFLDKELCVSLAHAPRAPHVAPSSSAGLLLKDYPALAEHSKRVAAVPEIAEWLRTRPQQLHGSGSD